MDTGHNILSNFFFFKVVVFAVFLAYIILLGSRLFTILGFILILFNLYQFLVRKKSLPITLLLMTLTLMSIIFIVHNQPFLKTQYSHLVENLDKGRVLEKSNGVNNRILQWQSALEVIKKNWIFGVTPGDTIDKLVESYKNIGFQYGADLRFNAHNQFLQNWVSFGIPGLSITIIMWILFFRNSVRLKQPYLIWLTIAILLFLNTECLLDRQAGLIFVMGILGMELFRNKKTYHV